MLYNEYQYVRIENRFVLYELVIHNIFHTTNIVKF